MRADRGIMTLPERGFTLIEVLVALIIFAIAFGAIAGIFQTALRQSTSAETLGDATALAERQIMRVGTELPLAVGVFSGDAKGGLSWQAEVNLATPPAIDGNIALYHIKVDVRPSDRRQPYVSLNTLRIGAAP